MKNLDIRLLISENGLRYKDVAEELCLSRSYLSQLMGRELSPKNRERILKSVERLLVKSHGEN